MTESPINVVIVDDHEPYRTSLANMLSMEGDLVVVGQGGASAEAIDLAKLLQPHLIILDVDMPGGGLEAAAVIARILPATKIIVLTVLLEERLVQAVQQLGAHGYLVKGISARRLVRALRAVYEGAGFWPSSNAVGL